MMQANSRRFTDVPSARVECLEGRQLLSGTMVGDEAFAPPPMSAAIARRQNLMSLLGYDKRGMRRTYETSYSLSGDAGQDSGSGASTISVSTKTALYEGHRCNVVKSTGAGVNMTTAWYSDASGVHQTALIQQTGGGTLNIRLQNVLAAPRLLSLGAKHRDSGTFSGTFKASGSGMSLNGSVEGKATATTRLYSAQSVTVPAGTFSAVKGTSAMSLSGTITFKYDGETYNARFSASLPQTFWAAPGTGIVEARLSKAKIAISMEGETMQVQVSSTARLTSAVATSAARPAAAAPRFSAAPIRAGLAQDDASADPDVWS